MTTFLLLLFSFAESAWFDSAFPEARDRRGIGVDSSSISGTGETSFSFCFFLAEFFEQRRLWLETYIHNMFQDFASFIKILKT